MTLRRSIVVLLAVILGSPTVARAANYTTTNFVVEAPTPELAKKFGEWAEYYRNEKAMQWLGQPMPNWPARCPLSIQVAIGSAGGATTFTFGSDNSGRPIVTSQKMEIRGEAKQLMTSVLPHEITHTVLAYHFGRAVPRWADEGGSVLSENDEERFSHDIRCRELLNAGRGIRLRVLFRMAVYPKDMIVLYAQGYSVSAYLVEKGGGGREGRAKLLQFLAIGMQGNDPNYHGSVETWNDAARKIYGFDSVDMMEEAWLTALKTPPSRTAARESGMGAGTNANANAVAGTKPATLASPTSLASATPATSSGRTELRSSAAPSLPVLEPPVRARGTAPEFEPLRPTYLPPTTGAAPATTPARTASSDIPPPVLLPPEIPRPTRD
jgi:hypothetical protein